VSGKVFIFFTFSLKNESHFVSTKWGSLKDCISRLWMLLEGFQAVEKGKEGHVVLFFALAVVIYLESSLF